MKKLISIILAVLMIATAVFLTSCGVKDWEKIQENGKFVCGITIYAPMNYYDADGDLVEDIS
ncbi:MAG: hypothetical protein E7622_05900 [Ruminococcaceae bacterium]|nr:hypothetical protein [Oscillospiraceae bacterium]